MATEHWFDRASARLTRRQSLKAAAAAGLGLTLPAAVVPAVGRADGAEPCLSGCTWFVSTQFRAAKNSCAGSAYSLQRIFLLGPVAAFFTSKGATARCLDDAILHAKAAQYDCNGGNNCGDFDPRQKGGPCDTCPENCCTCQGSSNGYICCFYPCGGPDSCCPTG